MDIFILAAIFGAAVALIALATSIRDTQDIFHFSLGDVHALVPRRVLSLFVITVACILILIVVFIAVGPLHPRETAVYGVAQFIQSRRFISTLLGLLFGVFLIFWTRQLLLLKPDQSITWVHRGEAIFLVLLLLLGALSDQISAVARRLTQFSAGGLTLTFETLQRGSSVDRGQQGRAGASIVKGQQSATALVFLSGLHGANGLRDRDNRYIEYSRHGAQSPQPPYVPDQDDAFFRETIGEMATCLNGIAKDTNNDQDVNVYVTKLRPTLREIVVGRHPDPDRIRGIAEEFVAASMDLLQDLARTYLHGANDHRDAIMDACRPLIALRCPDADTAWANADANARAAALVKAIDRCRNDRDKQVARLTDTMSKALAGPTLFDRPYLSVFYASLLWRLEDYEGAVRVLEDWLNHATPQASGSPEAARWDAIRVRSTLSVIMEDWVRSADSPPPLVLVHHLANLAKTMDLMRAEPIVETAWEGFRKNGYDVVGEHFAEPVWPMDCSFGADQIRLAYTLMQQHMAYAYRATQHPDYFDDYAREVVARRDFIMKVNLSCLAKDDSVAANLIYAELLQVYGEVEIANAVRIARLPDAEEARRRLQNAADAAMLGSEMIADYARAQQKDAQTTIVRDQKATELKYLLQQVKHRAQEALGQ